MGEGAFLMESAFAHYFNLEAILGNFKGVFGIGEVGLGAVGGLDDFGGSCDGGRRTLG